ncbi:MAG: DDE-type integrase/transposase/recombinase [Myxococcales bacterium]|nr:DDE-type integrase/transposase/recombinase [Myxococcales bacterium]
MKTVSTPSTHPESPPAQGELDERRREIALFRFGVIADLVQLEPHQRGLYAMLTKKAEADYTIPGSLRRHVAAETMRGWLRDYRRGGFDALVPRERADVGSSRSIPAEVVDRLCQLKEDCPELSIPLLIKKVRLDHHDVATEEVALPESTVHRLLARRGLMKKKPDDPTSKDRRRFEHEAAGDLWMSDVMYGPKIREGTRTRRTYLIAIIDDATRVVPYAAFAFSEGTVAYLPVLEQAVRRRGIPKRLYVDNGAAFRSKQLALVCAKLGIALIHAKPYAPQGKGKMERWFRTARMQLLPMLRPEQLASLEAMNRALAAWIEGEYHHAPHRGLGDESPADKWARTSEGVRMPAADLGDHFLAEQKRFVQRDRTVTLDGVAFEVDAALVGERVTLRFDPARKPNKRAVEVWHQGRRVEIARRVDMLANSFIKRNGSTKNLEIPKDSGADEPVGMAMRDLTEDEVRRLF